MTGAGAHLWQIKEYVEDVLSTPCDAASTANWAPGAMRRVLAKRLKFEGPENTVERSALKPTIWTLPIERRRTPIRLRSVALALKLLCHGSEASTFEHQLRPTEQLGVARQKSKVPDALGRPQGVAVHAGSRLSRQHGP